MRGEAKGVFAGRVSREFMATFSNDGSFMEQFLAMQQQIATGAGGGASEKPEGHDAPSRGGELHEAVKRDAGAETGSDGGNESSASGPETGSTEAAQPLAPSEQPKAAAADSQKKKSLLAAFSTKKTIKKDVGASLRHLMPSHEFMCISMSHTRSFPQAAFTGGKETKKSAYLVSLSHEIYVKIHSLSSCMRACNACIHA